MSFNDFASGELRTLSVNLSMLASTASAFGKCGSNSASLSGPDFGGMMTFAPASRSDCSARKPVSFMVRAVMRTFQDMGAESSGDPCDSNLFLPFATERQRHREKNTFCSVPLCLRGYSFE